MTVRLMVMKVLVVTKVSVVTRVTTIAQTLHKILRTTLRNKNHNRTNFCKELNI